MATTSTLFCDTDLAARVERAEADLIGAATAAAERRGASTFLIPFRGGVASFAGDGSPYNKVAGLGFDGVPAAEELESVERAFAAHGAPTQVELAHLADPPIGEVLSDRGYRLESFENVLGRELGDPEPTLDVPGVEIRRSPDEELDTWLEAMADAVAVEDTQGLAWHEEFPRATYLEAERDSASAGVRRYAAVTDGNLAGGAGLRLVDGIAQMAGAATVPAYRRRGIQNALFAVRLADAVAEGCDLAVVVTQPGSKSHQNAQRRGFHLLYTRAVLVKHLAD
jgi:ribosomal protein S18 acetylase RimI-like enzyme